MASEGQPPDEVNPSELRALERELRALVPRGPNIEMARLMYRAGQASLAPVPPVALLTPAPSWQTQWLWPASTAVAATAAAWLGVLLFLSQNREVLTPSAPRVIVKPDVPGRTNFEPTRVDVPSTVAVTETITPTVSAENAHYLQAREKVLSGGVDALAETEPSATSSATSTIDRRDQTIAVERELGINRSVRGGWSLFGF